MNVSIWNKTTKKYIDIRAVTFIANDTVTVINGIPKESFAIETKTSKKYYAKELYSLDFIHSE